MIERLDWRHLREFGGGVIDEMSDADLIRMHLIGLAGRDEDGELLGIGLVVWRDVPEGMFHMRDRLRETPRSRWVHRLAFKVLAAAHRVEPTIYAHLDEAIPRAREWLERLGFTPPEGDEVMWRHDVVRAGGDNSGEVGRLIHHGQRGAGGGDSRRWWAGGIRSLSAG